MVNLKTHANDGPNGPVSMGPGGTSYLHEIQAALRRDYPFAEAALKAVDEPHTSQQSIDKSQTPPSLRLPESVTTPAWQSLVRAVKALGVDVREEPMRLESVAGTVGDAILIDPRLDPTRKIFFLLHLFGHLVQFLAPALQKDTVRVQHRSELGPEREREEFRRHEAEDAQLGLSLIDQSDMDPSMKRTVSGWLRRMAGVDHAFARAFVHDGDQTSRLEDFADVVDPTFEQLQPRPIPEFTPQEMHPYLAH